MKDNPIGILDSGIGGLTVWAEVTKLLPHESIIYYSDSANCPYGAKNREQITALAERCIRILIDHGVKLIVIACNTITAAAIEKFRADYPQMLFVGMEPAIKPAAEQSRTHIVGVLATQATLQGELYHRTAETYARGTTIIETAGHGLVEMIELGLENTPQCQALVESYIRPMIHGGVDQIVLGCTHYPFLTPIIAEIAGPGVTIINPAGAVARQVSLLLSKNELLNQVGSPNYRFLSSAEEQTEEALKEKVEKFMKF